MKRKVVFIMAAALIAGTCLYACADNEQTGGSNVEGLDKLAEVKAVAREEGSGTRAVFAQLTGLESSASETASDMTRDDAKIEESGESVLEAVKEDNSAIGYVSAGTVDSNSEVKTLSVNGVFPDEDTIENGKYPLSRSFYLAYSGKLSDLERDFLEYVKGAGQAIVAEDFVAIGSETSFLSYKSSGKIKIEGSTSVAPLMKKLAEDYSTYNPGAEIIVEESDSTRGLTAAIQGECDLAMASRELESYEKELLSYDMIAKDGILITVNKENPLQDISIGQLNDIYDGTVKEWEQLNK